MTKVLSSQGQPCFSRSPSVSPFINETVATHHSLVWARQSGFSRRKKDVVLVFQTAFRHLSSLLVSPSTCRLSHTYAHRHMVAIGR